MHDAEVSATNVRMVCRDCLLRCASEPKQMALALGQLDPFVGELQEIPCRGLMNGKVRLTSRKADRDAAGLVRRVDLKMARLDRHRVEAADGLAAHLVSADAAQDRGVIAQPASHYGKVGGCAAEPRPSGNMSHSNSPIPRIKCGSFISVPPRNSGQ